MTPLKIKIVLSKGILWTSANGVDLNQTPQNAESDQGHHCLLNEQELCECTNNYDTTYIQSRYVGIRHFGDIGKQCKPRSDAAE